MLIQFSLSVTALLVIAYIVGSEMCLPSARYALRTGNLQLLKTACFLVALGEWAMIVIFLSLLILAEHFWHLFSGGSYVRLAGLLLAGLLAGVTIWELVWRTQRNYARVMSSALDLVLPANGVRREIYHNQRRLLESGSPSEQEYVLQHLYQEGLSTGK